MTRQAKLEQLIRDIDNAHHAGSDLDRAWYALAVYIWKNSDRVIVRSGK